MIMAEKKQLYDVAVLTDTVRSATEHNAEARTSCLLPASTVHHVF